MTPRRYPRGQDFPHEAFVQAAIERHFAGLGYEADSSGIADLQCWHRTSGDSWIVEAKGATAAVGLDVRTGLGQLLQRMGDRRARFALAVPDTPPFLRQLERVPAWVREQLGLSWLLVAEDGSVRHIEP